MHALTLSQLGSRPARADGARRGWMALIAAFVVLGIVGMHGIGLHGSQHADPGDLAAPSAVAERLPMTGHGATPGTHGLAHSQGQSAVMGSGEVSALASPVDLGHGMAGMAMLCIAMLVGAALAWSLLRSHRGSRGRRRGRVLDSIRVTGRAEVRQTGPPMVLAFSVVRC